MPLRLKNLSRYLVVSYSPDPAARKFLADTRGQERDGIAVRVSIPDATAGQAYFGVPVARRGIQPIWVEVTNGTPRPHRLQCVAIDPDYYSPFEAAAVCHFSGVRKFLWFGALAWLYLPFVLVLAAKLLTVGRANRRMDAFFREQAFRLRPIPPGGSQSGFVYATRTEGTRTVLVQLLGPDGPTDFEFSIPGEGLNADHARLDAAELSPTTECPDLDLRGLRKYLEALPAATTDRRGRRVGDPVNLVIVADFATILGVFGARWDETEVISLGSCWRTVKAFLTGAEYRYSPISPLFLLGRSQDFALQRIRNSINERMHLRLWRAPVQFRGKAVWVGQISRDIGVRLTRRTWNLMTHRIDPDVDEARDFVVEDVVHHGRAEIAGYVDGVGPCDASAPRHNLTGDPYYTDGKRAVVLLSGARTAPRFVALE
jgi:LssY C-terminus